MIDNYDKWEEHEANHLRWLTNRPICDKCGNYIQDDYYYQLDEECLCEDCVYEFIKKEE